MAALSSRRPEHVRMVLDRAGLRGASSSGNPLSCGPDPASPSVGREPWAVIGAVHSPVNSGGRFWRNAEVASTKSFEARKELFHKAM